MYKRKETHGGVLNTPVTFFRKSTNSPYPDQSLLTEQFSCLAEIYESSTKDLQQINTSNSKHVITLIYPNPYTDFKIRRNDVFVLQASMYEGIEFDVEHFAPHGDLKEFIKVVGVSYG